MCSSHPKASRLDPPKQPIFQIKSEARKDRRPQADGIPLTQLLCSIQVSHRLSEAPWKGPAALLSPST